MVHGDGVFGDCAEAWTLGSRYIGYCLALHLRDTKLEKFRWFQSSYLVLLAFCIIIDLIKLCSLTL